MAKIIRIKSCLYCPWRTREHGGFVYCENCPEPREIGAFVSISIKDKDFIPKWCPLQDEEDYLKEWCKKCYERD